MNRFSRRKFLGGSLGAAAVAQCPVPVLAAAQCVSGSLPGFLPNRLTVDCASRQNFKLYRQNSTYLGLTGVVSMSFVKGKIGSYQAGNLFLFPWLKPKGVALGRSRVWSAVAPANDTSVVQAAPIPDSTLPLDEYFCRLVLQAPYTTFIGFAVDQPFSKTDARLAWFSNADKLADGKGVGIDWTSANLNHPWFGGSRFIPGTDDCSGRAWRQVIVDGLMQASVGAC
jgi:hypothetical protein